MENFLHILPYRKNDTHLLTIFSFLGQVLHHVPADHGGVSLKHPGVGGGVVLLLLLLHLLPHVGGAAPASHWLQPVKNNLLKWTKDEKFLCVICSPQDWAAGGKGHDASSQAGQALMLVFDQLF